MDRIEQFARRQAALDARAERRAEMFERQRNATIRQAALEQLAEEYPDRFAELTGEKATALEETMAARSEVANGRRQSQGTRGK